MFACRGYRQGEKLQRKNINFVGKSSFLSNFFPAMFEFSKTNLKENKQQLREKHNEFSDVHVSITIFVTGMIKLSYHPRDLHSSSLKVPDIFRSNYVLSFYWISTSFITTVSILSYIC